MTKMISMVYSDDMGLVMEGGIRGIIFKKDGSANLYPATGYALEVREINSKNIQAITSSSHLRIETFNGHTAYIAKAYDEISVCDNDMYFTDAFSGEDKRIPVKEIYAVEPYVCGMKAR